MPEIILFGMQLNKNNFKNKREMKGNPFISKY